MAHSEFGPWELLSLSEAVELFDGAAMRWWFTGGYALELHLGRSWREHDDLDLGIVRSEAAGLRDVLSGWDIYIGADGVLTPWGDEPLDASRSQDNLWCRRAPDQPWCLDITVGDGDDDTWIFRRDHSVRRPWADTVLTTSDGTPYLSPEIQLLFKSRALRPKDQVDAEVIIPELTASQSDWLAEHLPTDHPWQELAR